MYSGSSEAGVSTSMTLGDVARGDADCGEGCFGVGRGGRGCGDAEGDCGRGGGSPGSASSSTVTFRGRVDIAAPFILRQSPLVVDEADLTTMPGDFSESKSQNPSRATEAPIKSRLVSCPVKMSDWRIKHSENRHSSAVRAISTSFSHHSASPTLRSFLLPSLVLNR